MFKDVIDKKEFLVQIESDAVSIIITTALFDPIEKQ